MLHFWSVFCLLTSLLCRSFFINTLVDWQLRAIVDDLQVFCVPSMIEIDGSPYQERHLTRMLIFAGGPRNSLLTTPSITHALLLSTLPPFHRFLCAVVINPALNWLYPSLRTARQSRLAYVIAMHYLHAVRVTVPQGFPWYCLLQWEFRYLRRYIRSSYTSHTSRKPWFDLMEYITLCLDSTNEVEQW